jgi:small subunit ribosomal protein S12e
MVAGPCREEVAVVEEVAEVSVAAAPGEPMDVNTAVQLVLKKALAHDGLSRGLHETTRALEKGQAQLCILAEDCDQPDYKKLIEALCAEHNVNLLSVPEAKQLGQWAGVRLCQPPSDDSDKLQLRFGCLLLLDATNSYVSLFASCSCARLMPRGRPGRSSAALARWSR